MNRMIVIIGLAALFALVFSVYHVERRVENLRAELKTINRQIAEDKNSMRVLNAEWSYITRPERLQKMAAQHLNVHYVIAAQIKDIEEIPLRPVMVGNR